MKTFRLLIIFCLVFTLVGFTASAGYATGAFTYSSWVQVQNVSGSEASISLTYYNGDGTIAATVNDTIPANNEKFYFPLSGVSTGFNGSLIVSSTQDIRAVSNLYGGGTKKAGAAYSGFTSSEVGSTIRLPVLQKGNSGFNTWFNVMNVGSADTDITVTYTDGTSNSSTALKPGASKTFDQSVETHSKKVFGATVTSTNSVPIAVTVVIEDGNTLFAYNGKSSGSTNPVLPLINTNNPKVPAQGGFFTGVSIFNAGDTATEVTLSYYAGSKGTDCTETQTIQPGDTNGFTTLPFAGIDWPGIVHTCTAGQSFVGSAKVTANSTSQPLIANVNQLSNTDGEAYGGFAVDAGSSKFVAPLILDQYSVDGVSYYSGFTIKNNGSTQTTITCTFSDSTYTYTKTLAAGASDAPLVYGPTWGPGPSYVGSAVCTADNSGKIIGTVNQLGLGSGLDQLLVYEALNITAP